MDGLELRKLLHGKRIAVQPHVVLVVLERVLVSLRARVDEEAIRYVLVAFAEDGRDDR